MSLDRFASARARAMPASVFATMDDAKSDARVRGHDVVDLSIGSSDLLPPPEALARLHLAADDPSTYGYCLQAGTRPLREAACDWYQARYGWRPDPDREALPLIGAQEGLANLLLATCDPGDTVLMPDPAYPSYFGAVAVAGLRPVTMPLSPDNRFLPDLEDITPGDARRARAMVLCYPNNPTAATASPAFFEAAVAFCARHDILLIHDFPYLDLTFGEEEAPSALDAPGGRERVVELYSFSKSYHMPGFRIGFALGAAGAVAALARVKGAIDFHAWTGIQWAAIEALRAPRARLREHAEVYRLRRDALVDALNAAGMPTERPAASMYVWTRLPAGWGDSYAFATGLVRDTGVAVAPGRAFGPSGEGWLRAALVRDADVLSEAARTMAAYRP